jgi:hypothetical protein
MNTKELLNQYLYPQYNQNVRRKDLTYYDELAIAAGVTEYYFFVTAPGNIYLRNKQLPLSGSEVFFLHEFYLDVFQKIYTTALANGLNELLMQSYLEVSVDNRRVCKYPGSDFVRWAYSDTFNDQVVVSAVQPILYPNKRKIDVMPIILNSTSSYMFKLVIPTTLATTLDGVQIRLALHGLQVDKLTSFEWDNLKNNKFQQVPVTYYNTQAIVNGNETTYQYFANPAANPLLINQTFPLSDIQTMSIQNIEIRFNQPDTPIEPSTIYYSRIRNVFKMSVDDVNFIETDCGDMLSLFAGLGLTLTTTPDLDVVNFMNVRLTRKLRVPLEIPANGKVQCTLSQPAGSLGITGEIQVMLRGVETRRVA